MGTINCNIITDILPLYVDDVVSSDTKELVSDHLHQCESCREKAKSMKMTIQVAIEPDSQPLKTFKKRWKRKQILIGVVSAVASIAITISIYFFLFIYGFPAASDEIIVETEYQYNESYYLNQEWVIHFKLKDGKSLFPSTEYEYGQDANGNRIETGYIINLREVPLALTPKSDNYTFGYGYTNKTPPSADFDFTVTVKYKDKTTTYSMSKEGLFTPQDHVIRY